MRYALALLVIFAAVACSGHQTQTPVTNGQPLVQAGGQVLPVPDGVDPALMQQLAAELERVLAETPPRKAQARTTEYLTPEREVSGADVLVGWEYNHTGDYDQNGEVNVADLTPIGQHFGKVAAAAWDVAAVADGDGNGEINISDVTPIGQNFGELLVEYVVESADNPDGPWTEVARVLLADGWQEPAGGLLWFDINVIGGAATAHFRVWGDGESGDPPPPPNGGDEMELWTDGPKLRGVNVWQGLVLPKYYGAVHGPGPLGPPYVQADFDKLAAWGCNYVNISHAGLYSVTPPYQVDQDAVDALDTLLGLIAAADMFAVITLRTGPGRSEMTFQRDGIGDWVDPADVIEEVWTDQPAQDAWAEMWRFTANRYKDNPIVVGYDLVCEPNAPLILYTNWNEPDLYYPAHAGEIDDINRFFPALLTAIREVDTNTPVIAAANNYSLPVWLPYMQLLSDSRVVYAVHQYGPDEYTHQYIDQFPTLPLTYPGTIDTTPFNKAWLETQLAPIGTFMSTNSKPVVLNEWGLLRYEPGAAAYINDMASIFEQLKINSAIWDWTSSFEATHPETADDSFNYQHGADPGNHANVESDPVVDAIKAYLGLNTVRPSNWGGDPPPATSRLSQHKSVNHFMYQIQRLELPGAVDALAATHYDALVIEPTSTFVGEENFDTAAMVATLKASADSRGGKKLVIAYIDVGQAEDYRTYWQPTWVAPTPTERGDPDFMITTDPDGWSGNYVVAYWDQRWIDIMIDNPDSVLNKVIDWGFDGIYMDWVEAYDDEKVIQAASEEIPPVDPPAAMVDFLGHLRSVAKARDPDFLVIQQNAPFLIEQATGLPAVIDGLTMEDTWFLGAADVDWGNPLGGDTAQDPTGDYSTAALLVVYQKYLAAGLPVWTVDYCLEPANAAHVYTESPANGLIPLVTQTSLMQITGTPPPGY